MPLPLPTRVSLDLCSPPASATSFWEFVALHGVGRVPQQCPPPSSWGQRHSANQKGPSVISVIPGGKEEEGKNSPQQRKQGCRLEQRRKETRLGLVRKPTPLLCLLQCRQGGSCIKLDVGPSGFARNWRLGVHERSGTMCHAAQRSSQGGHGAFDYPAGRKREPRIAVRFFIPQRKGGPDCHPSIPSSGQDKSQPRPGHASVIVFFFGTRGDAAPC